MMFKRNLSVHSGKFQRNGYVLLKYVIYDEFMANLKDFHHRSIRAGSRLIESIGIPKSVEY